MLLAAFIAAERRAPHPMLDLRLFRNPRFSAASGAVTVSFFTLLGFIFLITQYFQFVRGYSALSAGVRLLPVALAVAVGSVAGTQLAVRAGTRLDRHDRARRDGGVLRLGGGDDERDAELRRHRRSRWSCTGWAWG